MYPEYVSKRRRRGGGARRRGREKHPVDESSYTPSFDQFFGYGSYNKHHADPHHIENDYPDNREQPKTESNELDSSQPRRSRYDGMPPDQYHEEDLIHKIREGSSNPSSSGSLGSSIPPYPRKPEEPSKSLMTSDVPTQLKDEEFTSNLEQSTDNSITFKSSEDTRVPDKVTGIENTLDESHLKEDAKNTDTEKLHNNISKLALLSTSANNEILSSPKSKEEEPLIDESTLMIDPTNISFKNYDKSSLESPIKHESSIEEPIKNFDTISFKVDHKRKSSEIQAQTKEGELGPSDGSLLLKKDNDDVLANDNETQIPTKLRRSTQDEFIKPSNHLPDSVLPSSIERSKLDQTTLKQLKRKPEQPSDYRLSIPRAIAQVIFSYPVKEPIFVCQSLESICLNSCFFHIERLPMSKKTLNIFKFDYTMVSSMLPNKSLYTTASYNLLTSPERRPNVFNWFTDILPKADASNYIKGGITNSKLYLDYINENKVTLDSDIWNTSLNTLNYSWSKLMLVYLEKCGKDFSSSNMLYVDRVILDRNKLLNDLRILRDHGLVFQYVIRQKSFKHDPSLTLAILFDEIYNRRFEWCKNIENINLFDSTNRNSIAELNHKNSNIKFSLIRPLKEIIYFKTPSEELKVVYKEFNRIRRKESISLIRSGAFFYMGFHDANKLQKYLEINQNFPTTDLHDYIYDLQHLIVSFNNVPGRVVADIDQEALHKASILSFGKIDNTLYVVKLLISNDLRDWEYGDPIMIVARNEKINIRTVHSLLRKIDWKISDSDLEFKMKYFDDRRIKITRS